VDVQQALLSKIIHDGDISWVVNARVTPEFFTDDRYRRVYEYLVSHWQKYGDSPSLAVTRNAFPSFDWPEFPESIDYFIDQLRRRRRKSIITEGLGQAATFLQQTATDPLALDEVERVIDAMRMQIRLETSPALDLDLIHGAAMEVVYERWADRMTDPGYLRGISSGFKGIDYVTGGFQPEQFIVMIGLPKSLKSSILLYMAREAHRQAKIPLFVGFEMSNEEQIDRLGSIESGVGLTKILNGTMNMREYNTAVKAMRRLEAMRSFVLSVDLDSAMTVSGIQAKVMEIRPDVVFIDGAYMMQSEIPKVEPGSPQALTDIARALKRLAQNTKIPIVVTTQASITRARGGKLNPYSAMYTQAWQQSADVLLGTEREEQDGANGEVMVTVKVLNSRSGPRADTSVVWDWTKGSVVELDPAMFVKSGASDDDLD
jgi:replicative DNA helicase